MSIQSPETQYTYSIHIKWRDAQEKDAQSGWSKLEKKGPWLSIPTHLGQLFSHTRNLSSVRVNNNGNEKPLLHYLTLQERLAVKHQQPKDSDDAQMSAVQSPSINISGCSEEQPKQHIINTLFALTCSHIDKETLDFDVSNYEGLSVTGYIKTLKKSIDCLDNKEEKDQFKPLHAMLNRMIIIGSFLPFQNKSGFFEMEVKKLEKIIQNLSSKEPAIFIFGGTLNHTVIYKIKKEKNDNTYSLSVYNTGLMSSHQLHPRTAIFSKEKIKTATQFKIKRIDKTRISKELIEILVGCKQFEKNEKFQFIYDYIATRLVEGFGNSQDVNGKGTQPVFKFKNYEKDLHQPQKHGTCTESSMQLILGEVLPDPKLRAKLKLLQIRYLIDQYGLEKLKKNHPGLHNEVMGKVGYLIQKIESTSISEMPEWQEGNRPMSQTILVQDWKAVDQETARLRKKWKAKRD